MRKALALILVFCIVSIEPVAAAQAGAGHSLFSIAPALQDDEWSFSFTDQQLDNLLAPIALYPDPLLAQVLLAATFPDQIDEAARTLRAYGRGFDIDSTSWDVSVKAVAHYPTVLSMMADKIDWTTSVGQAYVNQSADVMEAVQRLRARARSAGNLVTTAEQEIVHTDGYIYIYPAQPRYIYVPVYDPAIIFFPRPRYYAGPVIWFGVGLFIGAWLNHDCDWRGHRVFYHGWEHGPRWIDRSRPFVRVTNIYVNNNYRNVVINRRVVDRNVNYRNLNRYNNVHRDVDYGNVRRGRVGPVGPGPGDRGRQAVPPGEPQRDNKIIRRNMDPNDPRIGANRGRGSLPPGPPEVRRPETPRPEVVRPQPRQPEAPRPEVIRPQPRPPEAPRPEVIRPQPRQPEAPRPEVTRPQPRQPERQRPDFGRGGAGRTETPRPQPGPPPQPRVLRMPDPVFRTNTGPIDSRDAGRRGHESRQQESRPAPAARPTPAPRQAPAQRTQGPPPGRNRGQDRRPR